MLIIIEGCKNIHHGPIPRFHSPGSASQLIQNNDLSVGQRTESLIATSISVVQHS